MGVLNQQSDSISVLDRKWTESDSPVKAKEFESNNHFTINE